MTRIERYTELLASRGKIAMALIGILMLTSLVGIVLVKIDTDFSIFMPKDSPQVKAMRQSDEIFGGSNQLLVLIKGKNNLESLKRASTLAADLGKIDGVYKSVGPIPETMLDQSDDMIKTMVDRMASLSGSQLYYPDPDDDGYWLNLRIFLDETDTIQKTVMSIEKELRNRGLDFTITGEPYLQSKIYDYIWRILLFLPPGAIVLLLTVFVIRIGSFRATLLSLSPAIVGAVLTLGGVCWIFGKISIMTVLTPLFIIVLGSADGLHITSHVMDCLAEGKTNKKAISDTLRAVGIPVILTSITTMAGFLSLTVIDSNAIRVMGIAAASGMLIAGAATWVVLPFLLLHQKPLKRKKAHKRSRITRGLIRLRGWPAILISVILLAVLIPGTLRLHSDFSMMDMYKKSTAVRKSIDQASKILGGAIPISIIFPVPADDPLNSQTANAVLEFQDQMEQRQLSTESISLYRVIAQAQEAFLGTPGYPESSFSQDMIYSQIESMNPDISSSMVSDKGWGRAIFFLKDLSNETLGTINELATGLSKKYDTEITPVGSAFAMKEMNDKIIPQQVSSLILAAILVGLLTILTQRSIKLGIFAVIPIIITLLGLFGYFGYSGTALSVVTSIMTGLTIGVGIDYAIHYVSMYRWSKKQGSESPSLEAMDYVATPILANALGLAIGFTVMALSPFQIHATLSSLMWISMILSAFLSLSLLPTLTGAAKEKIPEE